MKKTGFAGLFHETEKSISYNGDFWPGAICTSLLAFVNADESGQSNMKLIGMDGIAWDHCGKHSMLSSV